MLEQSWQDASGPAVAGANAAAQTSQHNNMLRRTKQAYDRYGWRLLPIGIYRGLFQWCRVRSILVCLKIELLVSSRVGSRVEFGKAFSVWVPGGHLEIDSRTQFRDRCAIGVSPNPRAEVYIGADCYFANDVHIYASREIRIGDNVRVGEFTSLRDSSHKYEDRNVEINQQGDVIGTIAIGDDVWIGRGCLILGSPDGLVIGRGAVIAAQSVVKESIPAYAVAAGAPAKVVKYRKPE